MSFYLLTLKWVRLIHIFLTEYTFRYLIVAQGSRLVYRIDGNTIYVVAFWDCRCDPEAQAKKVK